jgi:DNA-binding transcriptional LysR family regulator
MKLQQLIYVVEIEKYKSMSKAAKKLFVSQPNLSSSIKNLENEIGITIFERNNRGVQVSQQGIEFLSYARGILSQCEKIS